MRDEETRREFPLPFRAATIVGWRGEVGNPMLFIAAGILPRAEALKASSGPVFQSLPSMRVK